MTPVLTKPPSLNGNAAAPVATELSQAQAMAARYRCDFIDLRDASIEHDLFRSVPVDLMFRYNFVPLRMQNGTLEVALADPRNLNTIDELSLLLHKKLRVKVATASQIADLLKKTEQSQRVLEEVTEGFTLDVVAERCGLGSAESLRRVFHRHLGVSPDAYRRRFRTAIHHQGAPA